MSNISNQRMITLSKSIHGILQAKETTGLPICEGGLRFQHVPVLLPVRLYLR